MLRNPRRDSGLLEQSVQPEPQAARFHMVYWFAAARLTLAFADEDIGPRLVVGRRRMDHAKLYASSWVRGKGVKWFPETASTVF